MEAKVHQIPRQPDFEQYLISRGIDPVQWMQQREQKLAIPQQASRVDYMRLSLNVKRNLDTNSGYQNEGGVQDQNDVQLKEDLELDFGDESQKEEQSVEKEKPTFART